MYEQEKDKVAHLTILVCYSIFAVLLAGESILLGWEMGAVVLLLLGAIGSWSIHITGRLESDIRLWIYFILTMLTFFFYGIHETSMYDLAPVIILTMMLYSVAERTRIINWCMITYYMTIAYDFVFVCEDALTFSPLTLTRLLLHFVLVYVAGYMMKMLLRRQNAKQKVNEEKIAELEEINRRTEQFLTNVSHELRTPINAVTGITAVMMKNESDSHKRKDIQAIQSAGRRLFQQIEDILDYTEIDTGRIKISEEHYMLSSIVNDIISEEHLREREHELQVVFDVDASIPATLIGDGRKIKKIIKHLLDNGIKFTKRGGVYVRISALSKPYGINLCIEVQDTGIGVSEEQLNKLRERFYQARNNRRRNAGGLGLGLSIVYGLTAAMEGFIQINSKEGEGTNAFVSIPQKIADNTPGMSVSNRSELCIACYLKPEKYEIPEVRDYYNLMISHMVRGLDLTLHRIISKEELGKLIALYHLTHLFVGQEEFSEDEEYFEELTSDMNVIAIVKNDYVSSKGSKVKLIRKPVSSLALVNVLNTSGEKREDNYQERHILCPGLRVLVVDDEPMNLMVAEGILKEYQMDVVTADSGIQAVELCKKESFGLVLLDHMMPEMDGVETLRLLRKVTANSGKHLTVIAFTANAVSGAREMFRQEGFDGFLSKPVEDVELERVLKRVLPRAAYVYADEAAGSQEKDTKSKGEEGKYRELEEVGILTGSGLSYCRGDEEFYIQLLSKFAQEGDKKGRELEQFLEEADCENYRIRVHALKSTAKMIGAEVFSAMARDAEDAAKAYDYAYLQEHHDDLLIEYRALVNGIQSVLGITREAEKQDNLTEIAREELQAQLRKLQISLETFETDKAEELINEMSKESYNETTVAELLSEISRDVDNFECSEAVVKVEALMAKLEGGEL